MNLIANRKFEEAVEEIRKANPFPAVCGRVCTRPCEETCESGKYGDSISIRALKRYASDYELARRPIYMKPCEIYHKEKVGIIGAGPAGLSAAVDLINLGYPVTVFEASKEPGGMLRYGIPPYRLPDRILKREIDWIKSLGIKIETGKKITDPATLLKDGFSAVLIAGGAPKSYSLGIDGENAKGVINALNFLREINDGILPKISGNVVVIGGGSTAFDAARSANRLGAKKVTLAYRRGIEEMPAEMEEIDAAVDEKVEILTLTIPKKIIEKNGKVTGIEFLKAKLGEMDNSGRRRPIPIKNSEFSIKADLIIPAIGAMADIGPIGGVDVTTPTGVIDVKEYGFTSIKGVFAAGDVELGPSTVVEAIGRGHEAAKGINAYLSKKPIPESKETVKTLQINLNSPKFSKSIHKPKRLIKKGKVSHFKEVMGAYTDFEAVEEASRCFSCGPCYICPTCLPNCDNKQLVAEIDDSKVLIKSPLKFSSEISETGPKSFKIKSNGSEKSMKLYSLTSKIDSDLCIGCGRCEELCAYRAISSVVSKEQRTVSQVVKDSCAACSACVSECPSGAISQGYMSDKEILSRLDRKKTPFDGVKGILTFWSTNSPFFESYDGITDIMSERKPSPMFLIRALAHAGKGLLIIRPDKEKGSHYLPWEESPENVLKNTWKLLESVGISKERIKYVNLQDEENPINLLKEFSKELDKEGLKKSIATFPEINISPFGEAITYLRIFEAYPEIKQDEDFNKLPPCKSNGDAYFEGCLPMLHLMGEAHNLYDISPTRLSIFELFNKLNMDLRSIPNFSCPSKGLLHYKLDNIVSKIEENNLKAYNKANPRKMIIGTPEAFASFSKDKKFGKVTSLVDELIYSIKNYKGLKRVERTVAIHKACNMDKDPYYDSTKELLKIIPGIKIVELNRRCGNSNFNKIDGIAKQDAENLIKEAVEKGADAIICTSPYCESHLLMCLREGSWRSTDIEISDVYQTLLLSIKGGL